MTILSIHKPELILEEIRWDEIQYFSIHNFCLIKDFEDGGEWMAGRVGVGWWKNRYTINWIYIIKHNKVRLLLLFFLSSSDRSGWSQTSTCPFRRRFSSLIRILSFVYVCVCVCLLSRDLLSIYFFFYSVFALLRTALLSNFYLDILLDSKTESVFSFQIDSIYL